MRLTTAEISLSALFAALIAGGAFVALPLGPVPASLQVLCVLLASMVLGSRLAALSAAAYLALGLLAPVHAGGVSGIGVLLGPTGRYLLAFIPAAPLTGWLTQRRGPTAACLLLAGLAGLAPIYGLGTVWLAVELDMGATAAVGAGIMPFVAADVVKAGLAAVVARALFSLPLGLPAPQRDR